MPKVKIIKKANSGLQIEDNKYTPLSQDTIMINGNSHEKGGTKLSYFGQNIEAEAGEPFAINKKGEGVVFGNMLNPVTGNKFKTDAKAIGKKEAKIEKLLTYSTALVNNSDPWDKWDSLKFNSGRVMAEGAAVKKQQLLQSKEQLGAVQQAILDTSSELGVDPNAYAKGTLKSAKKGSTMQNGGKINWESYIRKQAEKQGVNPDVMANIVNQESSFNPKAVSKKNAMGIMQFTEPTAKSYGLTKSQLTSTNPQDVEKVIGAGVQHFKGLLNKYNHDYTLALAAYNGSPRAIESVRKELGKKDITGQDWLNVMQNRKATRPSEDTSAWHNETLSYINNIMGNNPETFQANADKFRNTHYNKDLLDPNDPTLLPNVTITAPKRYPVERVGTPNIPNQPAPPANRIPNSNQQIDFTINPPQDYQVDSDAEAFDYRQVIPELYAAATNKTEPVFAQRYNPDLYQPYNISLQDRRNLNNATFRGATQRLGDNPGAVATLAAQKYEADNQVNAEEFRINQGIASDVINKNNQLLNDAQLKNLQIGDTQYVRQAEAKSKTKAVNQAVLNSISGKLAQHSLENKTLRTYENLYPHYRFGEDYKVDKVGAPGSEYLSDVGSPINGNQHTSTTQYLDNHGHTTKTIESTPSAVQQRLNENKLAQSEYKTVQQMLKGGGFNYNPRTKKTAYSPLKGYDYSKF